MTNTRETLDSIIRDYRGNLTWLPARTIYLTLHGSHAYGLADETSDVDFSGICVPPKRYFTGFLHRFEQAEFKDKTKPEGSIFNVVKFIKLAADCNPNVVEVLWTAEEDHLVYKTVGQKLLDARQLFLSKRARYSFSGYAISQLKRIKTHRRWLLTPPKTEPTRVAFGLPDRTLIPADQRGAANKVLAESPESVAVSENFLEILQRENAYSQARREWEQYQTWKATRNPKRAAIEAKFGFDCKHAMHLVRLMRMAKEILTTRTVHVRRPDAEELRRIRAGEWEFDRLVEYAERCDAELERLMEKSLLRTTPDMARVDELCREVVEEMI